MAVLVVVVVDRMVGETTEIPPVRIHDYKGRFNPWEF